MKLYTAYRKLISILLVFGMAVGVFSLSANAENETDENTETEISEYCNLIYDECATSSAGKLFVNFNSGRFYFEDVVGEKWYSNPDTGDMDEKASGVYRMELQSLLIVHYYDVENKQFKKANSEANSVRRSDATVEKSENGFKAVYSFEQLGFVIPVEITLTDEGIKAFVNCRDIKEEKPDEFMLFRISLLPYFGAGAPDDQGYIVVADGCGALMNFNNGKYTKLGYSSHIYGEDLSKYVVAKSTNTYAVSMPVFGIKKENSVVTAIVEEGAAQGTIWCFPNNSVTSYANVYTAFDLRADDSVVLGEDTSGAKMAALYEKTEIQLEKIGITYISNTESDADYNKMAETYKNYLSKRDGLKYKSQNIGDFALDFYCAVPKKKSVLGFPVTVKTALSRLSDINKFISSLYKDNINDFSITLRSWSREQLSGKIDYSMKPVSVIGKKSEIQQLADLVADNNGEIYLNTNINSFKKAGKGYNKWFYSAKSLSNAPIYVYEFYMSNYQKNKDLGRYSLIKPSALNKMASYVNKNICKYENMGLSLGEISTNLYSDFNKKDMYNIEETALALASAIEKNITADTAFDFPADYIIKNTKLAQNVPSSSSQANIFDKDIPFVQLVLSGTVTYTSEAINLAADEKQAVLEAAANGSALQFDLITEDEYSVVGTELNGLYKSNADLLYEEIKLYSGYFRELDAIIQDGYMISYTENGKVSESYYSNGVVVTVDRELKTVEASVGGKTYKFTL